MAEAIDFAGATHHIGPPPGEEERCGWLHCLRNGSQVVSAWKFTREQLLAAADGDCTIYASVWSGGHVLPLYVGTKTEMNQILLDFGKEHIR